MKICDSLSSNLPGVIDRSNLSPSRKGARIEIKMKSGALLPSNLPGVIDRSNLSPRPFAAR